MDSVMEVSIHSTVWVWFTKGLHEKKHANLKSPAGKRANWSTEGACLLNEQNNTYCWFSTFPLMNMQHGAFLPKCANTWRRKCKYINLAQAMWFMKPKSDCGNCSRLCTQCYAQMAAVTEEMRSHGRKTECTEDAFLILESTFLVCWKKMNTYRLCSDSILELLDELRNDLKPHMRLQAALWSLIWGN